VRTPESTPEQNRVNRIIDIDLSAEGTITATARLELLGEFGRGARSQFSDAERAEWTNMARAFLAGDLDKRFLVDSVIIEGLNNMESPMIISFRLLSRRPIDRIGGTAFLQPFQFSGHDRWRDYLLKERESRVDLGVPHRFFDSVTIRGALVDASDSIYLPASQEVDTGALGFKTSFTREGAIVTATFEQAYRDYSIPAPDLLEFSIRRKAVLENRLKLWSATK
ncbi:MAG: hypothetical protein AAB305_00670, partial [Candidatus Zixiibacteriota bacterium]